MVDLLTLWITGGLLIGGAIIGWLQYMRVVAKGHRIFSHVAFAFSYIAVIETVALFAVEDEGMWTRGFLFIANILGIAAMISLVERFRG